MSEVLAERGNLRLALVPDVVAGDPRKEFDNWSEEDVQAWRDGEVYGWAIEEKCDHGAWHVIDSCWGMYGFRHAVECAFDEWNPRVKGMRQTA